MKETEANIWIITENNECLSCSHYLAIFSRIAKFNIFYLTQRIFGYTFTEYHVDNSGIANTAIPFTKCRRSQADSKINKFLKSSVNSILFRLFHKNTMLKQLKTIPMIETITIIIKRYLWSKAVDNLIISCEYLEGHKFDKL